MSDFNANGVAAWTKYSSTQDPRTQSLSSGSPPPNYSDCVSQPTMMISNDPHSGTTDSTRYSHPGKTHHVTVNPISEDSASETHPLNGIHQHGTMANPILHGTTSSAPFLDDPPGSENRNVEYAPRPNLYTPQPAYNPSYTAGEQNNPPPKVHGRKTIVLQRTDAERSARKKKMVLYFCLGILISLIIFAIIFTCIWTIPALHTRRKWVPKKYVIDEQNNENSLYDRQIFDTPHVAVPEPYLTNRYDDNADDKPWKPKKSDEPTTNPYFDDNYKDIFHDKPREEKIDDELNRILGISPDFADKYKDILHMREKNDEIPRGTIIKPIGLSDEMKDILGIPRE